MPRILVIFKCAMTRKELCEKYDLTESAVKSKFTRVQQTMLKKYKLVLTKTGRGDNVEYFVTDTNGNEGRALMMSQEKNREVMIAKSGFNNMLDFTFMVFLAICTTPMGSFYGSYEGFLNYVEVQNSSNNIQNLKNALEDLANAQYIEYVIDKTDKNYFNVFIYRQVRLDMGISLDMVKRCQKLAKKYNKQSWVPLLKTWIGVQYMYDKQPFTVRELCDVTGLSEYQLRESKKILEKDELFVTSRAYVTYDRCIGSNVELNGIYEVNRKAVEKLKEQ